MNNNEYPYKIHWEAFKTKAQLEIHDDLLRYIGDSLRWIPTLNPTGGSPCNGLCMHGITVIQQTGAPIAAKIFGGWAAIFECGPEELSFWPRKEITYEDQPNLRFELPKEQVVKSFNLLITCFEAVARDDNFYVLHHGI